MEQEIIENQQEENFQSESDENQNLEKKKKREAIFELSLFFILGILIGVSVKTEAVKRITIGFDDYQLPKPVVSYNIADMKSKLDAQIEQQQAQQAAQQQIQQTQIGSQSNQSAQQSIQ